MPREERLIQMVTLPRLSIGTEARAGIMEPAESARQSGVDLILRRPGCYLKPQLPITQEEKPSPSASDCSRGL